MRSGRSKEIYKGLKFRLYPNPEQESLMRQHGGNTRFLWNQMLSLNQIRYKTTGKFVFGNAMKKMLPELKKDHFPFLKVSHSQSLQFVCETLSDAMKDSFQGGKGFPNFKRKSKASDSFTIKQKWKHTKGSIYIPKVGWVKWEKHRPLQGVPTSITVSQDGNQWYISVKCRTYVSREEPRSLADLDVYAIDLGLKDMAIGSDGTKFPNPRHLKKVERKIKRAQRSVSRKQKGSNRRKKAVLQLRRLHRKLKFARRDYLNKLTHPLVKNHDVIVLENLNVKGMLKNHKLAKSISDVGWGELRRQLEYKADWAQKRVVFIDRFFPSTKQCSGCGNKKEITLEERTYHCSECGLVIDRDINAALNIRKEGLRILQKEQSPWTEGTLKTCGGSSGPDEAVKRNGLESPRRPLDSLGQGRALAGNPVQEAPRLASGRITFTRIVFIISWFSVV